MAWMLRLLGRFELFDPTGEQVQIASARLKMLIARLALEKGRPVPRARLWALLWEDRSEEQARSSLRQACNHLRTACRDRGEFPFDISATSAAVRAELMTSDLDTLASDAPPDAPPHNADFLDGLSIYGADAETWLATERQHWQIAYRDRMAGWIETLRSAGDLNRGAAFAHCLLTADPCNEVAHRMLMHVCLAEGDRVKALRQFQLCQERLREEFGIPPSPETLALRQSIRAASAEDTAAGAFPAAGRALPSIVVLPFHVQGEDRETVYFAENLAETLTDDLSRFHDLHVVSVRPSSQVDGTARTPSEICQQFGVRFALEGGVRRHGNRSRVTARLIDASDGRVVWIEHYDRSADDVLALQDELAELIVAALATSYGGRLRRAFVQDRRPSRPENMAAFDYFMRGLEEVDKWTSDAIDRGEAMMRRAVEIDPGYAKALAKLSFCDMIRFYEGWSDDYDGCLAKAEQLAARAIEVDPGEPWGYWALACCRLWQGQHGASLELMERARRLNPNDPDLMTDHGLVLTFLGRAEEGYALAQRAMRINPLYPDWYAAQAIQIAYDAGRFEDAVRLKESLRPNDTILVLFAAAAHIALGEPEEAAAIIDEVSYRDPERFARICEDPRLVPYANPADRTRLLAMIVGFKASTARNRAP